MLPPWWTGVLLSVSMASTRAHDCLHVNIRELPSKEFFRLGPKTLTDSTWNTLHECGNNGVRCSQVNFSRGYQTSCHVLGAFCVLTISFELVVREGTYELLLLSVGKLW